MNKSSSTVDNQCNSTGNVQVNTITCKQCGWFTSNLDYLREHKIMNHMDEITKQKEGLEK